MPKLIEYTDPDGYRRKVSLADNAPPDENPDMGIPISVDFSDLPIPAFNPVDISNYLYERGLIEPNDFDKPGTDAIILEVLRRFYKLDAATIKQHALSQKRK